MHIDGTEIIMTYINMGVILLVILGVVFWAVKREKNRKKKNI